MIALREKIKIFGINSQDGAALLIAVLILLILTVLGVYAVTTSTLETKITGFHKWHVEAFYAADAGLDYTVATYPYGSLDPSNPTWPVPPDPSPFHHDDPDFDVRADYLGSTPPPVGSGTGIREGFKAHHYRTVSVGSDSAGIASATVEMWGYRIGF
jgi:hypothetical protein